MTAVVPTGATTGPVVVTTPAGTLTSNRNFQIVHLVPGSRLYDVLNLNEWGA